MVDISVIETEIVNILKAISEFKMVLDYEPLKIDNLPAATCFYTGFNIADRSLPNSQSVTHNWAIRVYVPLENDKKAQDEIKALIPKVVTAFKGSRDLNGTCLYSILRNCSIGVVLDQNKAQIVADFQLEAEVRER
ncbi:MAG: hypothetical protein H0Z35_12395 [Thermoanaerobacteraceae bacterium]|nr:hypothetical protein [Thermoanaerobacteraceae bacterium]